MQDIIFSFEGLRVWQISRELSLTIYKLSEAFPKHEIYGLTSQIRRCSTSIAANLAEGSGRTSPKDKAHFTTIAYGSMMELISHLSIAVGLNYLSTPDFKDLKIIIKDLSIKLTNLKNAQLKNSK